VIRDIRSANIKLWVLTGDKIETAINIGFSCELLDSEMEIFIIDKNTTSSIYRQICEFNSKVKQIGKSRDIAVVVGGEQLLKITKENKDRKLIDEFLSLVEDIAVVLACRVSPKQKAEIVNLIKNKHKDLTTLAIGDGANDVNMITAAHLGIGISGLEGQ